MQWLAMIITYFFGRKSSKTKSLKEMAIEIFDEITFRSRKVVTLTMMALGAVIIFCGGFFIALIDATSQYDRVGYVGWSATLVAGLSLIGIASAVFATVFARAWPTPLSFHHEQIHEQATPPPTSGIEAALSALIMDFVKERELRRQGSAKQSPPPQPEPSTSHKPSSLQQEQEDAGPLH